MAWRCFHCGEVLRTEEDAAQHFGKYEDAIPICKVGAGHYREMEAALNRFIAEADEATSRFYGYGAEHARKQREAEEKGYAKGLRDAAKQPWITLFIALGLRRSY